MLQLREAAGVGGLYRPDRYHYRMRLTRGGDDIPREWVNNDLIHRAG